MLAQVDFSLQNISDNQGIAIALTGMLIVFAALVMISGFIAVLPKVLSSLADYLPEEGGHHTARPAPRAREEVDESVAVAIGFALHARSQRP